jgi:hypothetical protein
MEVQQQLGEIGTTDIVIGISTYNSAQTITPTLEAIREGLAKYFLHARAALVNTDAGSTDGTADLVASAQWAGPRLLARHDSAASERVTVPYHGVPGRARAQRFILEAARQLDAKACALVDPACRSISAEWVDRLLRPVLEDAFDLVAPLYQRHRYDGTLTNGLVYPLFRALYGKRIRHPLGEPTALSGRLAAHLSEQDVDGLDFTRHGLDLWMTAAAVTGRFAVCQAWLGPYVIESQGRTADLSTTFAQVVGSMLALLAGTAEGWSGVRGSEAPPTVGTPAPLGAEPRELNVERMIRAFRLGLKDLLPLWEQVLASDTLGGILALGPQADETFAFPHDLWARVVYDFALGYHFRILYRDHLLRSLVPLYLAWCAAFIRSTSGGGARESEAWIERTSRAFEREKAYLVGRWQ